MSQTLPALLPLLVAVPLLLGALGVAVEAKLRCVPKHLLRERVEVMTRNEVAAKHADLLRDSKPSSSQAQAGETLLL